VSRYQRPGIEPAVGSENLKSFSCRAPELRETVN